MEYRNNTLLISLIILVLAPLLTGNEVSSSLSSPLVIASHCSSKCGDVTIPYPFGIEEGCNYVDDDNPKFDHLTKITCNHTFNPPRPILGKNVHVSKISLEEGEILVNLYVAFICYGAGVSTSSQNGRANMVNFTISDTKNMFVAKGCDTYAWFTGTRYGKQYSTGCMTKCYDLDDVVDDKCNGVGCCEASIPDGVTNLTVSAHSYFNHTKVEFNPCSSAFPIAKDLFEFKKKDLTETLDSNHGTVPVVFNWGIGAKSCSVAKEDGDCLCKSNTDCKDLRDQDGYRCHCKKGFTGNPYHPEGWKSPAIDRALSMSIILHLNTFRSSTAINLHLIISVIISGSSD